MPGRSPSRQRRSRPSPTMMRERYRQLGYPEDPLIPLSRRASRRHICGTASRLDSCRVPLLEPVISFRLVGPASQPCATIQHKKSYKRGQCKENCCEIHEEIVMEVKYRPVAINLS